IVTNKPRWLSESLLNALNLTHRCAVLVCPEDVAQTKPDPEPMYLAAKQIEIAPEQGIYVGDHPRDIDAGRNAQMYTILAAYGYLPL
ncbi:HAD family hydrolase, partial [Acinetobacter sp. ULE_I092]|uniref:HAD family hydrolase n=1 Tax=Acinetobacter sp. ULE_I092 TaxID=3373075 RepID=UPI003AF51268